MWLTVPAERWRKVVQSAVVIQRVCMAEELWYQGTYTGLDARLTLVLVGRAGKDFR